MSRHPSSGRGGRSAASVVGRRRLAGLGCVGGLSGRQASAAEVLGEDAATEREQPGVFDAVEVRRRAGLAALGGGSAASVDALPGVGELPALVPGPRLAALLGDLSAGGEGGGRGSGPAGLGSLSEFSLVEVAAGADRLASWAAAVQADALAVLADRQVVPVLPAGVRASSISPESMAGRLVAARVCWSPRAGESRVREAGRLRSELSATLAVLRAGRICPRRARVIVEGTAVLDPQRARRVEARVLPRAEWLSPAKLRQAIERLVAADDPQGAEDRHAAAVGRREVCWFPLPDGMAEIVARLSAPDAEAVMAALTAAAVAMKAADPADPRTIGQRRADALAEIGWAALASGRLDPHPHSCRRPEPGSGAAESEAGTIAGGQTGGAAEDRAESGADGRCGPEADGAPGGCGGGRCGGTAAGCGCAGRRLARRGDRPVSVGVTVPLTTLIGLDDQPGELAGYGPIPASVARRLAGHGTWRRLVTDLACLHLSGLRIQ